MHCNQLNILHSLYIIDEIPERMGKAYKFFPCCAKFVNVWRENFWAVYRKAMKEFVNNPELVVRLFRRLPPRAIAGRWGSLLGALRRLADTLMYLRRIWPGALQKNKDPVKKSEDNDREHQDLRVDQQREHRLRMGQWRNESISLSVDLEFEACVKVGEKKYDKKNVLEMAASSTMRAVKYHEGF